MKESDQERHDRRILGIDPGTGRLGWAVIEKDSASRVINGGVRLVDCGLVESKANTPLADRLEQIYEKLLKVIEQYHPDELAIEELFFSRNVTTGISVAHARGVAMLSAKLAKMPIFEYSPNEIKLAITGYGHADKSQICKMLKLHLNGCNIKQDDTADAVAVALTHLQMVKHETS